MLKTPLVTIPWGEAQNFEWFSQFKHGETSVKIVNVPSSPFTCHTDENVEKIFKIVNED
jgi:hypothetical protein